MVLLIIYVSRETFYPQKMGISYLFFSLLFTILYNDCN